MRVNNLFLVIGLAALMVACSGRPKSRTAMLVDQQPDDVDLYAHVTGIDDNTPVEIEEEDTEQAANPSGEQPKQDENFIGGNRGAFLGRLLLDGKETDGTFTVKAATAQGEVVKENVATGSEIRLTPGVYDFVFKTDNVVGHPEFTLRDVEIPVGRRIKRDVKMPVGKITLVTGGRCVKKPIKIRIQGASDWMEGKFYTCQQLTLLAGTYDAEMGTGRKAIPISGIQVYDGGIRDVLIRNQ